MSALEPLTGAIGLPLHGKPLPAGACSCPAAARGATASPPTLRAPRRRRRRRAADQLRPHRGPAGPRRRAAALERGRFDWLVVTSATTVDVLRRVSGAVIPESTRRSPPSARPPPPRCALAGYQRRPGAADDNSARGPASRSGRATRQSRGLRVLAPQSDIAEPDARRRPRRSAGYDVETSSRTARSACRVADRGRRRRAPPGAITRVLVTSGSVARAGRRSSSARPRDARWSPHRPARPPPTPRTSGLPRRRGRASAATDDALDAARRGRVDRAPCRTTLDDQPPRTGWTLIGPVASARAACARTPAHAAPRRRDPAAPRRARAAGVRARGRRPSRVPIASMPGVVQHSLDSLAAAVARPRRPASAASCSSACPSTRDASARGATDPDGILNVATARRRRRGRRRARRADRPVPRRVHRPRPLRRARRRRPRRQRRHPRALRANGARPGRGRARSCSGSRHDGRPGRRRARRARRRRARRHRRSSPTPRSTPRRSTARSARPSSRTLEGDRRTYQLDPANRREGAARGRRSTSPRAPTSSWSSRRCATSTCSPTSPPTVDRAGLGLPGVGRVRDDRGRRRERLDRPQARDRRVGARHPPRRRRRRAHLLGDVEAGGGGSDERCTDHRPTTSAARSRARRPSSPAA